ncbi:MAG: transposase [Planctomycetota bacterium]
MSNEDPLAYLLTWPTYGTWLPGDERGWIEYHEGWKLPDPALQLEAKARMAEAACVLAVAEREIIESQIAETCKYRNWVLHAVNCRSNHIHVVVSAASCHPEKIRNDLKAWSTRRLRSNSPNRKQWWAERGSQRYINDKYSLEQAILYVRDAQDK